MRWFQDAVYTRLAVQLPYAEMEEEYAQHDRADMQRFLTVWCLGASFFCLESTLARLFSYGLFSEAGSVPFVIQLLPNVLLAIAWPLGAFVPVMRRHVDKLMSLICFLLLGVVAARMVVMTNLMVERSHTTYLVDVWQSLGSDEHLRAQLGGYVRAVIHESQLQEAMLSAFFTFNTVQFMGLRWHLVAVYAALPVLFSLASYWTSGSLPLRVLLFSLSISAVALIWSVYVRRKQGQRFVSDYMLQRSREKEAQVVQEGMQKELTFMDMARRADTVLNHILKNTMADAAGCIQLYAGAAATLLPPDLAQALSCLDAGMRWCKNRQTLLRVSSGDYVPALTAVNLREFGQGLVRGRPIEGFFTDLTVMLDAVLCSIMLDNGLMYMSHLVDANGPRLRFATQIEPHPSTDPREAAQGKLTFSVMGHAPSGAPPLTPDIVARLLSGELHCGLPVGTDMADHLGLQYMFLAAEAVGMDVFLGQDDDQIKLRLSVHADILHGTLQDAACAISDASSLPDGLTVLVIDDSAIARRLLVHTLTAAVSNVVVRAYGQSPAEVEDFLDDALAGADIVILDQHLDYGSATVFGTELLQLLHQKGFAGFSCIRSANVSAENQAAYLRAGADCAIGKDVRPDDLLRCLAAHYAKRLRGQSFRVASEDWHVAEC
eukprot:EG_transcript_4441